MNHISYCSIIRICRENLDELAAAVDGLEVCLKCFQKSPNADTVSAVNNASEMVWDTVEGLCHLRVEIPYPLLDRAIRAFNTLNEVASGTRLPKYSSQFSHVARCARERREEFEELAMHGIRGFFDLLRRKVLHPDC